MCNLSSSKCEPPCESDFECGALECARDTGRCVCSEDEQCDGDQVCNVNLGSCEEQSPGGGGPISENVHFFSFPRYLA